MCVCVSHSHFKLYPYCFTIHFLISSRHYPPLSSLSYPFFSPRSWSLTASSFSTPPLLPPLQDPGCTAYDLVNLNVPVTVRGLPINTNVLRNYTITYSSCDLSVPPNCDSISRVVEIVQTRVPVITMHGSAFVSLEGM